MAFLVDNCASLGWDSVFLAQAKVGRCSESFWLIKGVCEDLKEGFSRVSYFRSGWGLITARRGRQMDLIVGKWSCMASRCVADLYSYRQCSQPLHQILIIFILFCENLCLQEGF